MPNKYKIKFTLEAEKDIENICHYVSENLNTPTAAMNIIEEIESKVMNLTHMPFSCSVVEDEFLRVRGYRKLIVRNFLVLYIVFEDESLINIMRVVYGSSNYKKSI